MKFKNRSIKGGVSDEYFTSYPKLGIITDYPDRDDMYANGLLNGMNSRRLWARFKHTSFNTNSIYKMSLSLNNKYPTNNEAQTIFEVINDAYNKGTRSFLLLGEIAYKTIFPKMKESFHKIRGSLLVHDDYPDALFLTTYHPREIVSKRYKSNGGQANLYLAFSYDILKISKTTKPSFHLPNEHFNINPTIEEVETFIYNGIKNNKLFAMDLETTSLRRDYGRIAMVGLATDSENAICIPFWSDNQTRYWKPSNYSKVVDALNAIFQHGKHMWQNSLFDVPFLLERGFNIDLKTLKHDTMLLHHAISPELPHDIGFITSLYGLTPYWKDDFLSSPLKLLERNQTDVRTYNCRDCVTLHQVLPGLLEDLKDNKQEPAYIENMDNINGAIEQMMTGVVLDTGIMRKLRNKLRYKIDIIETILRNLGKLPEQFNLNSGEHVGYFLFGEQFPKLDKIPELEEQFKPFKKYLYVCDNKKHKKWVSHVSELAEPCKYCGCLSFTYADESKTVSKKKIVNNKNEYTNTYKEYLNLINLRDNTIPIIIGQFYGKKNRDTNKLITDKQAREAIHAKIIERLSDMDGFKSFTDRHKIEYKQLKKLSLWLRFFNLYHLYQKQISTYTNFKPWNDGRLHSNILLHGTASGRPASRNPNLLNISKKYKDVRYMFQAPAERVLVSFDYSNIEAKMLAYITNDERFIHAVNSGNLHDINTKQLFNIDENHPIWNLARRAAKIFQFGYISYGGSPKTIWEKVCIEAPGLNLSLKQFKKAGERYFNYYTRFAQWRDEVSELGIKHRYSISPFGRIRFLYGSDNDRIKQSFNHPPQSGAAHVMNKAMKETLEKRDKMKLDANLQIQIYDDLRWEVNQNQISDLINMVIPIMEQKFIINGVDRWFETDLEIGNTWGDLHSVDKSLYLKTV